MTLDDALEHIAWLQAALAETQDRLARCQERAAADPQRMPARAEIGAFDGFCAASGGAS